MTVHEEPRHAPAANTIVLNIDSGMPVASRMRGSSPSGSHFTVGNACWLGKVLDDWSILFQ
jgi:hypothetical protein